ncbi:MAG: NAD(P)/FAD-dependent oxidoreductase [Halobacteriaceae archaeon]
MDVGIVGGGVAGLAAAHRLQAHGHDPIVFEAAEDLGGLAATYPTKGDRIERFYHHLSKTEETIVALIEELGLGDRLEWPIGKNAYYIDGVVHPLDTIWEIAAFPHLGLYDTFRLGMLTLGVDVRGGRPRFDTYDDLREFEDVGVREFVVEHTTEDVYRRFFEPLLEAKFGRRKEDVSAAWLLGRIQFRGERDLLRGEPLGYLEGGFGVFVDALIEAVGDGVINTGTEVTAVHCTDGAVEGVTVTGAEGTRRHAVDAVIVAAMPNVLEALTGYTCTIDFQGTVCSVLGMREPLTDTYWLNVADEAPFGALIEHTNYIPPGRYGGEHLLYVPKYVQGPNDPVWQMDDAAVEERWLTGIEALFPNFDRGQVEWIETSRNPRTAPVYERGYLDQVIPYDLSDAVADGLYYAGMASMAQYPERSLNGAVEAGYSCADLLDGLKPDFGPDV